MRLSVLRKGLACATVVAFCLATAGSAWGARITLNGDERINDIFSGLLGIDYTTASNGVDYDQIGGAGPHPGQVVVSGSISTLNYHTTGAPGVNVSTTPGQIDLDFSLTAQLLSISAVNTGGTIYDITMTYGTATPSPGAWDLVITDPDDSNAVVFEADLTAGLLFGSPTQALVATATGVDITTTTQPVFQGQAFLNPNAGSEYGGLFDGSTVGLSLFQVFNFAPNFTVIGGTLVGSGTLVDHTAQSTGTVFGITSASFTPVPEPGTFALVGVGIIGAAITQRRRI